MAYTDTSLGVNISDRGLQELAMRGLSPQVERAYDASGNIMQRPVLAGQGGGLQNSFRPTGDFQVARPTATPSQFNRAEMLAVAGKSPAMVGSPMKATDYADMMYRASPKGMAPQDRALAGGRVQAAQMVAQNQAQEQAMTPEQRQIIEDAKVIGMPNAMKLAKERAMTGRSEASLGLRKELAGQNIQLQRDIMASREQMADAANTLKKNISEASNTSAMERILAVAGARSSDLQKEGKYVGTPEGDLAQQQKLSLAVETAAANGDVRSALALQQAQFELEKTQYKARLDQPGVKYGNTVPPVPTVKPTAPTTAPTKPAPATAQAADVNGDGKVDMKDVQAANGELSHWQNILLKNVGPDGQPLPPQRIAQIQERMKVLRSIKPIKG